MPTQCRNDKWRSSLHVAAIRSSDLSVRRVLWRILMVSTHKHNGWVCRLSNLPSRNLSTKSTLTAVVGVVVASARWLGFDDDDFELPEIDEVLTAPADFEFDSSRDDFFERKNRDRVVVLKLFDFDVAVVFVGLDVCWLVWLFAVDDGFCVVERLDRFTGFKKKLNWEG